MEQEIERGTATGEGQTDRVKHRAGARVFTLLQKQKEVKFEFPAKNTIPFDKMGI